MEKNLKPAGVGYAPQVICLDSHAIQRNPAVAELVKSRGHVLLLHGGGATGYEQINDTNWHATYQARIEALDRLV